jgi:hypothetical protein
MKYKILNISGFLLLLFFLNSCATNVRVSILKPATIYIGDLQNLAVSDFEFIGDWTFKEEGTPPLTEVADKIIKNIIHGNKRARNRKPHPKKAFPGSRISEKFETKLLENGHYTVVERDEALDKVLNEQKFSMSGMINEGESSELGQMKGVDAYMFGSGRYYVDDIGEWYTRKNDNDIIKEVFYKIQRKIRVELTYKVVNVETGQIVASKKLKKAEKVYSRRKNKEKAIKKLSDWEPIVDKITDRLVNKAVKQIAPHYIRASRQIKHGKSVGMKTGLEYAKRNMWNDAKESWQAVLKDKTPDAIEDKIHAKYNIGVYHEIHDELDQAEELFNHCYRESGKSTYLDAVQRVQTRKEEILMLKDQQQIED